MSTLRLLLAILLTVAMAGSSQPQAARVQAPSSAGDDGLFERLDGNGDGQLAADEIPAEQQRLFARLVRNADADGDQALDRNEFLAGLEPMPPDKPLEEKSSGMFRGADALRYLLLRMDTDGDSQIEADEVPTDLLDAFAQLSRKGDKNKNQILDRFELAQGGPQQAGVARQFIDSHGIDATAEVAKLRHSLGPAADRFDKNPSPGQMIRDPQQAEQLFVSLDGNSDGLVGMGEVPEPFRERFERLVRRADRNGDAQFSRKEFLEGTKQLANFLNRIERAFGKGGKPPVDAAETDSMEMPGGAE